VGQPRDKAEAGVADYRERNATLARMYAATCEQRDKAEASLRDSQSLLNDADRDDGDPVVELRGMISDLSADVGKHFVRRCSALRDGVRCVQPVHHQGAHHTGRGSEQWQ